MRRDSDKSKIDMTIEMLSRSVKHGFIPDYVLTDSCFFCFEILEKLSTLKNGAIKLVSMVKINNQKFFDCKANKELPIRMILKRHEKESKTCKSMKSKYIRVTCKYKGIRVNLFFVKMGRSQNWHLLLTTNLTLNFIDSNFLIPRRLICRLLQFVFFLFYCNIGSCIYIWHFYH